MEIAILLLIDRLTHSRNCTNLISSNAPVNRVSYSPKMVGEIGQSPRAAVNVGDFDCRLKENIGNVHGIAAQFCQLFHVPDLKGRKFLSFFFSETRFS